MNKHIPQIAVFCSGGGGNLQYLISTNKKHNNIFAISCVYVDRECGAVKVALEAGIKVEYLTKSESGEIDFSVVSESFDLYVLAGFLSILPKNFCGLHDTKIINIHPSLLPDFGGKGMYGSRVHEAVLASGRKITGATTHFVNEKIDEGRIISQRTIPVIQEESAWDLGGRVFKIEGPLLFETIKELLLQRTK